MPDQTSGASIPRPAEVDRLLRWTGVVFAVGFAIHGIDHLHRGMTASPMSIMIGGNVQAMLVAAGLFMALTRRRRAPEAAIAVGFGSAVVFVYAHLLPTFWPAYQDSYLSLPHTNVTWFSWLTAIAEISTGIVFGLAGVRARRAGPPATAAGTAALSPVRPATGPAR